MSLLYSIKKIINSHQILECIYYRLKSIIRIIPYYLVEEGVSNENNNNIKPKMDTNRLEVGLLHAADMKSLSQNPEMNISEQRFLNRLKNGWYCMGIRYNERIIAYLWYTLKQSEDVLPLKLNSNEAYITDVRTFKPYRGKNLAPYLRYELYKYLRKTGRNKFYSITFCYNDPAVGVIKKIRAKRAKLLLYIRVAGKFSWNIVLKSLS